MNLPRSSLLTAVFLLLAPIAATFGSWSFSGPSVPAMREFRFAYHSNQIVYGVGDQLLRSTNLGRSWRNLGFYIGSLRTDPFHDNVVWGTIGNGVVRSDDFGLNWRPISAVRMTALRTHPSREGVLYGLDSTWFKKSTDEGRTWTAVPLEPPDEDIFLEVDSTNGEHVFVMGYRNIYESSDGGRSFRATLHHLCDARGSWPQAFQLVPGSSLDLYAISFYSLYRSSDAGAHWHPVVSNITSLAIDPGNPRVLYALNDIDMSLRVSRDSGVSWNALAGPFGNTVFAVGVHPRLHGFLMVASGRGLFRSYNGGASWRRVVPSSGGFRDVGASALIPLPARPGHFFLLASDRTLSTSNYWKTWKQAPTLLPFTRMIVHPRDPQVLVAGGYFGIAVSTNGGDTWNSTAGLSTRDLALDPRDPRAFYVVADGIHEGDLHGLARTTDLGRTWQSLNHGLEDEAVVSIAVDPKNPSVLYAGTPYSLYRSGNRGHSWRFLAPEHAQKIFVSSTNPAVMFLNGSRRSTDGGLTWQDNRSMVGNPSIVEDTAHPGTFYATGGPIWETTDYGEHWSLFDIGGLTEPESTAFAVSPWSDDSLFACGHSYRFGTGPSSPRIRQVVPGLAAAGQTVSVVGSNFGVRSEGTLTLGGVTVKEFAVWGDSRITFKVPGQAAAGNLVLTTPAGKSQPWLLPILPPMGHIRPLSGSPGSTVLAVLPRWAGPFVFGRRIAPSGIRLQIGNKRFLSFVRVPPGTGIVPVKVFTTQGVLPLGNFTYR